MTPTELLLAVLTGLSLALVWALVFTPVRLTARFDAGYGLPADAALALDFGPGGLALVRQPGSRAWRLEFFVFGKKIARIFLPKANETGDAAGRAAGAGLALLRALEWIDRHMGLEEVLRFLVAERGRVRIDSLRGTLRYGFEEYEKTGMLHGYLWSLRGALGPAFQIQDAPDWSGRNVFGARLRARLRLFPVFLLIDLGLFLLAHGRPVGRLPTPWLRRAAAAAAGGLEEARP